MILYKDSSLHVQSIQTGAILENSLDKWKYERCALWGKLYEVQRTSELYEWRSGIDLSRLFFKMAPVCIREVNCLYKVSSYYTVCTLTKFSMLRFACVGLFW